MVTRKKKWSELSRAQQMGVVILGMLQVALLAAALADLRRRPAAEVNGSKALWSAAVFINFAGPIAYFLFGRKSPAER